MQNHANRMAFHYFNEYLRDSSWDDYNKFTTENLPRSSKRLTQINSADYKDHDLAYLSELALYSMIQHNRQLRKDATDFAILLKITDFKWSMKTTQRIKDWRNLRFAEHHDFDSDDQPIIWRTAYVDNENWFDEPACSKWNVDYYYLLDQDRIVK